MNAPRTFDATDKPLGHPSYGSIGHLPSSRTGPQDRTVDARQSSIALVSAPPHHEVIVQEKLDGGNVGVARINDEIIALSRAGYRASVSKFELHHVFDRWVRKHDDDFRELLGEGERVCGEWLAQAHGTKYDLSGRLPLVVFDMWSGKRRLCYDELALRFAGHPIDLAPLLHRGSAISLEAADALLGTFGHYGALEPAEGVVYRVEHNRPTGQKGQRERQLAFIAKWVRASKVDGKYLGEQVWNWREAA